VFRPRSGAHKLAAAGTERAESIPPAVCALRPDRHVWCMRRMRARRTSSTRVRVDSAATTTADSPIAKNASPATAERAGVDRELESAVDPAGRRTILHNVLVGREVADVSWWKPPRAVSSLLRSALIVVGRAAVDDVVAACPENGVAAPP